MKTREIQWNIMNIYNNYIFGEFLVVSCLHIFVKMANKDM